MDTIAGVGSEWWHGTSRLRGKVLICLVVATSILMVAVAEPSFKQKGLSYNKTQTVESPRHVTKGHSGYQHVWPDMKFGLRIVAGTIIAFFGAAFGSVGGVGGGGIFIPMLTLIIGFDSKSSAALSKCMITGAAATTVLYNLRLRHPTLELPIIDYDLALLFLPMLILGISIGVTLNVLFADWMIIILLIIFFIVTSTRSFFKGVETWKKETKSKQETARAQLEIYDNKIEAAEEMPLPGGATSHDQTKPGSIKEKVSIIENIYWMDLGTLVTLWLIILALQIGKSYTANCSAIYWILNILQIPVAAGVTSYEAVSLYKGRRKIASKGGASMNWPVHKLVLYCIIGVMAGTVGGMLGLGGGFILAPLFLEMGIPPQVSSATATFAMMFSASLSVVEYYLLKRFPVPYALYFFTVATIAAVAGQHVVRKLISILGRASLIIFILASTIFVSAILVGGAGMASMIKKFERKEYMGFESICS
ncbi:hypothetical protein OIU76_018455 [Salix suchowensis]|nr:sulfite exporter TauE/SafE family protein [Salix suchowensis]KAJ6308868.1 hypothetical protein OIU76_018455 [Salix suchowensis]KAJ6342568.1 hypothetical protein OIU78_010494 [Salix suchowensis]